MHRRQLLAHAATACAFAAAPTVSRATARPVTLVVPYAPGGTTDMLGRMLARELGSRMGRRFIVDNKPGSGSGIGAAYVARSAPDGQTLLVATSSTLAINPWLYRKLGYEPQKDFTPIGLIGTVPLVALVNLTVPARTVAELVALGRSRPDVLAYGSAGNGSPHHLAMEMFKAATGARLSHVPYKGSGPAVADLIGGRVHVMFSDIPPTLAHLRSGRVRALGISSARRQPALPEVSPIAESGAPGTRGFEAVAWQSLVAPAGTPPDLVAQYAEALQKVLAEPDLRARLAREGFEPASPGHTPERLAAYIQSETVRWGKVIRMAGVSRD